jgi:hypothetical protein
VNVAPGSAKLRNSRFEQLLCVSYAIPLYISGWREIIYMLCYSFVVMLVMNHVRHLLPPLLALLFGPHGCLQFVTIGVSLLVYGHIRTAETFCACLFMSFAFFKLLASALDFGKERSAAPGRSSADTPRLRRKVKLDETETLVFELQATPSDDTIVGTPHWPSVSDFLQRHPRLRAVYERLFPAISLKGYSVETVIVVLSCFSVASGLSAGITGASGPPTIIAYSTVDATKGAIRGLIGLRVVSCVLEMCVLARSCCACAAVSQLPAATTCTARTAHIFGSRGAPAASPHFHAIAYKISYTLPSLQRDAYLCKCVCGCSCGIVLGYLVAQVRAA